MKKFILLAYCFLLLASMPALAKKAAKVGDVNDSEFDTAGDTCKPEGKCTFTRREVLPGGIQAEAQIVSLGAFRGAANKVFDFAFGDVRRVASLLNEEDPASEVSKVNDNAGVGFVEVGPEFSQLIKVAKKAYLWTDGAFDITTTPLAGNFKHIKIAGNMVFLKRAGMKISFDNIISGYLTDLLIRAIYNSNIDNAIATVGSASRSIGESVAGHWRTDVYDSEGTYAKRGMSLDTSNISVASVVAGRNAPVQDPRWGIPVIPPVVRSVTIISMNAAVAEALAHGIFVLGAEKGMVLIGTLQTIKGVIVDSMGNFLKSPGL